MKKTKKFIIVFILIFLNFQVLNILAQADTGKLFQPLFHRLTLQEKLNYTLTAGQPIKIIWDTFLYKFTNSDFRLNQEKQDCLLIPVTLTNNSADTLKFIGMSCSWWDLYRTDDSHANILQLNEGCYKNGPAIIKIAPYNSVLVNLPIGCEKGPGKDTQFRIGMVLQKYTGNKQIFELNKSDINNIIWSNEIEIP